MEGYSESFWNRWLFLVVLCLVVLSFDSVGWLSGVKELIEPKLGRLEYVVDRGVGVTLSPVEIIGYYRNGTAKIADLEARNAELLVENVELERLREENHRMRELLKTPMKPHWQMLPVKVLVRNDDWVLIDVGKKDKIEVGMSVVVDDVLFGVVSKVSEGVSEVSLVGGRESRIEVFVGEAEGVLSNDDGVVVVDEILQSSQVEVGDVVTSAGTDGVLPGLVVGRVSELLGGVSDIYKQAMVVTAVREREFDIIFVVFGG